jgi:hypothetical protein
MKVAFLNFGRAGRPGLWTIRGAKCAERSLDGATEGAPDPHTPAGDAEGKQTQAERNQL